MNKGTRASNRTVGVPPVVLRHAIPVHRGCVARTILPGSGTARRVAHADAIRSPHWRSQATKARTLAEQAVDQVTRRIFEQLAVDYDKLADSIELYRKTEKATLAGKHI